MSRRKTKVSMIVTSIATAVVVLIFFGMKSHRGSLALGEMIFWVVLVFMLAYVSIFFAWTLKQSKDESTKS